MMGLKLVEDLIQETQEANCQVRSLQEAGHILEAIKTLRDNAARLEVIYNKLVALSKKS